MIKQYIYTIVLSSIILTLTACATRQSNSSTEIYQAGYYVPSEFHPGENQPAYTDAFGNVHPAQEIAPYEQSGRWVRSRVVDAP